MSSSSMRNSLGSYKVRGVAELLRLYRSKSNGEMSNVASNLNGLDGGRPRIGNVSGWPMVQMAGVRLFHTVRRRGGDIGTMEGSDKDEQPKPSAPRPPSPPRPVRGFPIWAKLVLGSVFSLLLAFWKPNWATLLKIEGEVEIAMKEAEQVAEIVEKVATVVEKVSEEVVAQFPTDNKIKEAALIVEHFSKDAAKDAHLAEQIIHKMDKVKQDLDDVGKIVEPIMEKIVDDDKVQKSTSHL